MNNLEPCRTYVDYLRAEHLRLQAEVRRIKDLFFERAGSPEQANKLLRELSALGDDLRRHFSEEEDGGCLEEAVCRCPSLAREAGDIERQHEGLLQNLDSLVSRLQSAPAGAPSAETKQEFSRFAMELLAHEAAENGIMQRAFGVTVNGDSEE